MLGRAVVRAAKTLRQSIFEWDVDDGDLSREKTANWAVEGIRPHVVVNCAGFTDVEACEDPARKTEMIAGNVLIPRFLARACAQAGSRLIHISTDYVFDGEKDAPYSEDDPVNPLSRYGQSKLDGELEVQKELPGTYLIFRTAWLYGRYGRNFVDTIREKVLAGEPLKVVDDQVGCPTFAEDLAQAILRCARARCGGVMHAVNSGHTSWFGFAKKIAELSGAPDAVIEPCAGDEYPTKARRPRHAVLSCEVLARTIGFNFRPWPEALASYLTGPKKY